jgi:exonuclease SbcD
MKLLHTSDWHVGKKIKGHSRLHEQSLVLAEIVAIAKRERVDFVIVAGDVFENASPTPEAQKVAYDALLALADTGARTVVIGGNHDNQAGLSALEPLLNAASICALGHVSANGSVELTGRSGEVARFALVPFLSQRFVVRAGALMDEDAYEHNATYDDRVRRIVSHLTRDFSPETVNIVVAHMMVHGGTLGGGERDAQTIFEYAVDPQAFPTNAHYVALGHLHRFQQVGGNLPAYYCGSPIQVDFGETDDEKGVVLVEVTAGTPAKVRFEPIDAGRRLRTVRGSVRELTDLSASVGDDYLRVFVREARRPGLADEVRDVLPNAVEVRIDPDFDTATSPAERTSDHSHRTASELFAAFLAERGYDSPALASLFDELSDEVTG